MTEANATNYYSPARWVVSKKSGEGTHTSISTALSDASSGETIFVMAGSYTENLTLVPGVNITSLEESTLTNDPNVTIIGKNTLTGAGNVVISGIRLQTDSDFIVAVTGTSDSKVVLVDCFLDCINNTGISLTSSNVNSAVLLRNCAGNIGTVGTTLFVSTGAGVINGNNIQISNSANSTTPSSASVGAVFLKNSFFQIPFSVTGTASIVLSICNVTNSPTDTTCVTGSGTGSTLTEPKIHIDRTELDSKSAANGAISIAASNHVRVTGSCEIRTNGSNAITGAGTLNYDPILLSPTTTTSVTTETPLAIGPDVLVARNILTPTNESADIGTATEKWRTVFAGNITFNAGSDFLDDYEEGTFTPTLIGSAGTIGTQAYSSQVGTYIKIGNKVTLWGALALTDKGSWAGTAILGGLPFTGAPAFSTSGSKQIIEGRNLTMAGSYLMTNDGTVASNTTVELESGGSGGTGATQDYVDIANNTIILYTFTYPE